MRQGCRKLLLFSLVLLISISSNVLDAFASSHSWVQQSQEYQDLYSQGMDGVFNSESPFEFETGDEQIDAIAVKMAAGQPLTEEEQSYYDVWSAENWVEAGRLNLLTELLSDDSSDDVGWVESAISGLVFSVGNGAYRLLNRGAYPFTINNLIFGRLCDENYVGINLLQFELTSYNPYGVVSAYLYRILRGIVYSLFLFVFLAELVRQVYSQDKKSRSELKNTCKMILFMFLLIYIFPKAADFVLYLKDACMKMIYDEFSSLSRLGNDIVATFRGQYNNHDSLLNAFMFVAAVFCVIPFAFSYIKIALMQLLLFGGAPVIFVLSIKNPKLLSSWASTFFSNIFIPVIDMVLILLPVLLNTIKFAIPLHVAGVEVDDISFIFSLIQLTCIFSVTPMRNAVLRLVGNLTGMQMGGSLGGLGMVAMMAARTMSSMKHRGGADYHKKGGNASQGTDKDLASHLGAVNDNFFDGRQNAFRDLNDFEFGNANDNKVATSQSNPFAGNDADATDDLSSMPTMAQTFGGGGISVGTGPMDDSDMAKPESVAELSGTGTKDLNEVGVGASVDSREFGTTPDVSLSSEGDNEVDMGASVDASIPQISDTVPSNIPTINSGTMPSDTVDGLDQAVAVGYGGIESVSQNRMDNLQKMDNYSAEMSRIADSNYQLQSNMDTAVAKKEQVDAILASGMDRDGVTPLSRERRAELNHEALSLSAVEEKCQNQIKANNNRMAVMRTSYDNASRAEKSYAEMYAQAGMSKQTYTSASAFKRQMRIDNAKRELATYKNFDTKQFEGVLTPAEREKYYRQRVTHDARMSVARAGLKAAYGTAVATSAIVGAAAGAYGGPSSAGMGAMLGASLPGMSVGLAKKVGNTGRSIANTIPNLRAPQTNRMYSFPYGPAHSTQNTAIPQPMGGVKATTSQPVSQPSSTIQNSSTGVENTGKPQPSVVDVFKKRAEQGANLDLSKYLDNNGNDE